MISVYESPPSPQEWHFHRPMSVLKDRDGVLSSCSGHRAIPVARPEPKLTP
ncbi:hypothetical protein STREPTOSP366_43790 [Streptomyces variabilis]